jgi:1,4-dihydroxy-2-naphthoyl-CoA hydrolase
MSDNAIWKTRFTLDELREMHRDTAEGHLGIEFTEVGDDWVSARMPVDRRTIQPFRLLHGGASCLLAEAVGSVAANMCVDQKLQFCVGLDINANHVRSARSGWVTGTARPLHVGKTTQVWEIRIVDQSERLVCVSRLTIAVQNKPGSAHA